MDATPKLPLPPLVLPEKNNNIGNKVSSNKINKKPKRGSQEDVLQAETNEVLKGKGQGYLRLKTMIHKKDK